MKGVLPYINHPVPQSGANVSSSNSNILPKQRGLMLQRGQALYCSVSGATALTNGFYCNVQAGYYWFKVMAFDVGGFNSPSKVSFNADFSMFINFCKDFLFSIFKNIF